jgi:hypothetical protein
MSGLFESIRSGCAEVMERARSIVIDPERLASLARELADLADAPAQLDPAHHHLATPDATLAYVITLDAVNFGSGYFPHLRKRPGCSGYFTVATTLKEHFEAEGAPSAAVLAALDGDACERIFDQAPASADVRELMALFARALRDLGSMLLERFDGSFAALVEAAGQRAEALCELLAEMPLYRDVSHYDGLEVPFYKRAQLTCADLSVAFEGKGPGRFTDLDSLTIFADNLVPHVLRVEGVLRYDPALLARIEAGELIVAGSLEEVEIRAAAVHAVECMCELLRSEGRGVTAQRLDYLLWNRGQSPAMKAHPRHRARSPFY